MARQAEPHFPPFPTGRRYAALGPALRRLFGGRTERIALDAGFTCPTRDGTRGRGGCLYCDAGGSRAASVQPREPVREQLARGIERALARGRAKRFIAYFQAFTNTYGDPSMLRYVYEEGLGDPRVVGLAVGTRPDCLGDAVLDVLDEFASRTFLWLEMGLQSTRDATLEAMRRGHTVADFTEAAERLRARGLRWVGHAIFGLPGDSREDMLAGAPLLNRLGAWGVKVHNLYVDRDAPLAAAWRRGEIRALEREEYLDLVAEFLARLSPDILIHRLVGQAPRSRLLAPRWCLDKQSFLRDLDALLEKRGLAQGSSLAD